MTRTCRFAFVCLAAFVLGACTGSAATDCDDLSFIARVSRADVIFVGRVLAVNERVVGSRTILSYPTLVLRAWKGIEGDTLMLTGSRAVANDPFATLAPGQTLVVYGVAAGEGMYRVAHCLGSRELVDDDPEIPMLDYAVGTNATVVTAEGGGVFSDGKPGPTFGMSIDRAIVSQVHARLRLSQGPYLIAPGFTADHRSATGHATVVNLAVRARTYLRWPGLMPFTALGLSRLMPVDGRAATEDLEAGLWAVTIASGFELPLGAQFGALVEAEASISIDGASPTSFALRAGVQVAM